MFVVCHFLPLFDAQIAGIAVDNPVVFSYQFLCHRQIVDIGGCHFYRMDIPCPCVHSRMA